MINVLFFYSSSLGPLLSTFHNKPDVCAPGYNIELASGENNYVTSIGTSYSAPHVAGAAALIKQLHPDWTPDMIKAALMETAVDVNNESVFAQGAGRIDAYKAALTKAIILPSSFSFGTCDLEQNIWKTGGTFTITNVGPMGGGHFSPIINYPEVAILGMGSARLKPVVQENDKKGPEIVPRLIMPVVLCIDHRVLDGADAMRFMKVITDALEDPDELLMTMI